MGALLFAALLKEGVPALLDWLKHRSDPDAPITDAEILEKLAVDVETGNAAGAAFLDTIA